MQELDLLRKEINETDVEMARLFEKRMQICKKIGEFKKKRGLSVKDKGREDAIIEKNRALISDPEIAPYYVSFLKNNIELSCKLQSEMYPAMSIINVQDYDIIVESGALSRVGEHLPLSRKVLVVTDSGVPKEYAEAVASAAKEPYTVVIPEGEESKSLKSFEHILSVMLENSFSRADCVVAVGGGVVGDLAGFAAACYMRGVDFYNVPTTLLSELDSSIGGKTAVDFGGVKNVVGAFYTPKKVIIDPDTLKTLDERQLRAGLAEAIKMAACFDKALFEKIENAESIESVTYDVIVGSLNIKKKVVEADFKEKGLRAVLNFGHTAGHAIEALSEGKYLHGECVAMGMIPFSSGSARERIKAVCEKYGLKTQNEYGTDELIGFILHDKKMAKDKVKAVLVNEIGSFEFSELGVSEIAKKLEEAK